jgi:hypothetical protein
MALAYQLVWEEGSPVVSRLSMWLDNGFHLAVASALRMVESECLELRLAFLMQRLSSQAMGLG